MESLDYHPLEGEKLQLVCWVVGLNLAQAPTGIGYYSICGILVGLVENNTEARSTGISVELERSGEICIGKNRHGCTQSFQVIKGLLAFTVPLNGGLFLASILTQSQLMQGLSYLHKFRDKPTVISHESQKTSDLCDICWGWPLPDSFYFALINATPWAEIMCPR